MTDPDPQAAVDFIRDNARKLGQAKGNRVYLEGYRKTIVARLMKASGQSSIGAQEREALASDEYEQHIKAESAASEEEETLRWLMVAAQARIDVWRSLESSNRMLDRGTR